MKRTVHIAGKIEPFFGTLDENIRFLEEALRVRTHLHDGKLTIDGGHNAEGKPLVMTDSRPPEKILALNQWIKAYAAEHDHVYLDYFRAMADDRGFLKKGLSEDGLHPNKAGYEVMAPLAQAAIDKALRKR